MKDQNYHSFPEAERLLRIYQVAKILSVSDKSVRRLIDSGKLRSYKPRGLRLIRYKDIQKMLDDDAA